MKNNEKNHIFGVMRGCNGVEKSKSPKETFELPNARIIYISNFNFLAQFGEKIA